MMTRPARLHLRPRGLAVALLLLPGWGWAYEVRIEGVSGREVKEALEGASQTYQLRSQPPPTETMLRRRVENDLPRLRDAMRAMAFYHSSIESRITVKRQETRVTFTVDEGANYRVDRVEIDLTGQGETGAPALPLKPRLPPGTAATTRAILDEEERLLATLQSRGYPFAALSNRQVVVDHETETVSITWAFETGRFLRFGTTEFVGLDRVRPAAIRMFIPWKEGNTFNIRKVRSMEDVLLRSGLFSTAQFEVKQDDAEVANILLTVTERKPRTIRLGGEYRSDVGFGYTISWEHRNLFGGGEQLETTLHYDPIEQSIEALYKKPGFLGPTRRLILDIRAAEEQPDAYQSTSIESLATIEQQITPDLLASIGYGYRYLDITQLGESDIFGLAYVPIQLDWNRTSDPLDPAKGFRLLGEVTPYGDTLGEDITWLKTFVEFRPYLPLLRRPHTLLASRISFGRLLGQTRDAIPADERFYAGGGGSIRGYDYQKAGPLADDGTPLGGTYLLEGSVELRVRLSDAWGGVLFLDGGGADEQDLLPEESALFWGAGFGLRYYTSLGPFRFDLAFPLNPRENIDSNYEFYISFGQAF